MKNVILVGFMGSGKTTIGRSLARRLGVPFLDTDKELRKQFGMTVAEVFDTHGEAQFRGAETGLLQTLVDESQVSPGSERAFPRAYVLSTGGGTPLAAVNQQLLRRLGLVVWLRARPETIALRCRPHLERRPLLSGHEHDLVEHIARLLAQREDEYLRTAHCSVSVDDDHNPDHVASQIRAMLR